MVGARRWFSPTNQCLNSARKPSGPVAPTAMYSSTECSIYFRMRSSMRRSIVSEFQDAQRSSHTLLCERVFLRTDSLGAFAAATI